MASTDHPGIPEEHASELAATFAGMARDLLRAGDVSDTLEAIVGLAVEAIEGCDLAGVFVLEGGTVKTLVETGPAVSRIDAAQVRTGEGPCLESIARSEVVYSDDLAGDSRWPLFAPLAEQAGARSALALPLVTDGSAGALNLYSRYRGAFGVLDRAKAVTLAALAGLALASARTRDDENRRADNLQTGLVTREIIGQAEGILMERERLTSEQAFQVLRQASQHLNVKLRDVAQNLVDTGERPDTGRPPPP